VVQFKMTHFSPPYSMILSFTTDPNMALYATESLHMLQSAEAKVLKSQHHKSPLYIHNEG